MNTSLKDVGGCGAEARAKTRAGPKSRLGKLGIVKPGSFGVLSSCMVIPLKAESSSDLLGIVELCGRFFQSANILKRNKMEKISKPVQTN